MDLSVRLLGTRTATQLRERVSAAVLQVGSDTFTRKDLAGVECFNFIAAASLTKILTAELQVKNLRDLFERISPYDLALPRLGAISLAVLGAAFEAKSIGGAAPLDAWATKHLDGNQKEVTTFLSVKHARQQQEPAPGRRRKQAPRDRRYRATQRGISTTHNRHRKDNV